MVGTWRRQRKGNNRCAWQTSNLDGGGSHTGYRDPSGRAIPTPELGVTRNDPEVIELHAFTRTATVEWKVRLFYSATDGDHSITIDNGGQPFLVTTETSSAGYIRLPGLSTRFARDRAWDRVGIHAG